MQILTDVRNLITAYQAYIGLLILAAMFAGFFLERFPASVIAVIGASSFLFFGIIDSKELFSVFSNPAPITIACMFILSGALLRTGTIDAVASLIIQRAKGHPRRAVVEMMFGAFIASAFMNNTPVVLVLIPIIMKLSEATNISAKKLLIPLSFVCILGGTTTLIGTSTNLIVDAVARDQGLEGFGIFDITPYGLVAALAGAIMLVFVSSRLLPSGQVDNFVTSGEHEMYLTELTIRNRSSAQGKRLGELGFTRRRSTVVTAVKRGGQRFRHDLDNIIMELGDQIVVRMDLVELLSMREDDDFKVGIIRSGDVGPMGETTVEATIAPNHPSIGQHMFNLPFFRQLNVRILGMTRYRNLPRSDLPNARIHAADRLLVTGSADDVHKMIANPNLFGVSEPETQAFRRDRAPLAIGTLAAVIILAAIGVLPLAVAAILGVGVILLARCLDAEEAWGSNDGNVLVLIFGMLAVGLALQKAGSVDLILGGVTPLLEGASPFVVIIGIYIISVLLTELVTNNAVAILMTPIAISLAQDLNLNPYPLIIAVMFAASASFATPIGYQTNTLVYAAGKYRYVDFIRAGLPLTFGVGLATCLALAAWA